MKKFDKLFEQIFNEETTKYAIFQGSVNGKTKVYSKSGIDQTASSLIKNDKDIITIDSDRKNVYAFIDNASEDKKEYKITTPVELNDLRFVKYVNSEDQVKQYREQNQETDETDSDQ